MKISSFIIFLIFVSMIFATFGMMVHESNNTYSTTMPDYVPLSSGNWSDGGSTGVAGGGNYDFVESINFVIIPLQTRWAAIIDVDTGFFTKLVAGISAIPYAIVLLPSVLFATIAMAGGMVTGFLGVLGIGGVSTGWFVIAAVLMILVWAVFKLMEFFQRVPI
jgi:hypothetical protein